MTKLLPSIYMCIVTLAALRSSTVSLSDFLHDHHGDTSQYTTD